MDTEGSVAALAWVWVIEALARSDDVDAALLCDLVSRIPQLAGDLGKEANGDKVDEFSSGGSRIRLDPAEDCESVLRHISHEKSAPNPRKAVSGSFKWDLLLVSFIERKKANLHSCALQQLKDTILRGTHPLARSLKEISGLIVRNHYTENISSGKRCKLDSNSRIHSINEQRASLDGSQVSREAPERNGTRIDCEAPELSNEAQIGIPADDNKNGFANFTRHGQVGCSNFTGQFHVPSEDGKLHQVSVDELHEGNRTNKSKDNNDGCAPSGDIHNNIFIQGEENLQSMKLNRISDGRSYGTNVAVEAENDATDQNFCDSDGYDDEQTDITMKKCGFLSLQCATSEDSLIMTETEPNLCMKCKRDGQLLTCTANSCLISVHESCLCCSVNFDDRGKFYCPFCAYSRAISEYFMAKKRVSEARKELSVFIGGRTDYEGRNKSKTLSMEDNSLRGS